MTSAQRVEGDHKCGVGDVVRKKKELRSFAFIPLHPDSFAAPPLAGATQWITPPRRRRLPFDPTWTCPEEQPIIVTLEPCPAYRCLPTIACGLANPTRSGLSTSLRGRSRTGRGRKKPLPSINFASYSPKVLLLPRTTACTSRAIAPPSHHPAAVACNRRPLGACCMHLRLCRSKGRCLSAEKPIASSPAGTAAVG